MKKLFVVKLAVAALLTLGSFSVAQEAAQAVDTPTPDVVADVVAAADAGEAQQSVSDNVLVEGEVVAPVEPVTDDVLGSTLPMTYLPASSACIGCGQGVSPVMSGYSQGFAPVMSGCVGCNQGVAPIMSGCVGCNQGVAPMSRLPMTRVVRSGRNSCNTGCSTCNTGCATPISTGCATPCNTVRATRTRCNTCATPCNTGCDTCSNTRRITVRRNVGCPTPCNTGCNTCGTITNSVQQVNYIQPVATATYVQPATAGCCGDVAQVTFNAPIQEPAVASSVIAEVPIVQAAPVVAAPVAVPAANYALPVQGCAGCGGQAVTTNVMGSAPVMGTTSVGCTNCGPIASVSACNNCGPRVRGRLRGRVLRNR